MIGEIRDLETAQIAVQAALTGHLVFSTLHTNDAAATVTRLLDMGVEDYLVTSTVNGVLAQRLVRRLCPPAASPTMRCRSSSAQLRLAARRRRAPTLYRAARLRALPRHRLFAAASPSSSSWPCRDAIRRLVLRHAEASELHRAGARRRACARCTRTACARRCRHHLDRGSAARHAGCLIMPRFRYEAVASARASPSPARWRRRARPR